jgi:uncharacterized membrane protein YgcG
MLMKESPEPNSRGGTTIYAYSQRPIYYGEGITFRLMLPEGYFVGAIRNTGPEIAFWIVVILAPLLCLLFWFLFGRDRLIVETVEFRAPDGLTPAEIGLFWDGKLQDKDLFAMFLYWANKGAMDIREAGQNDLELNWKSDLPMNSKPFETNMFRKIFSVATTFSMKANALTVGDAMLGARKELHAEFSKEQKTLYEKRSLNMRALGLVIALLPIVFNAIYAIDSNGGPALSGAGFDGSAIAPIFFMFIFIFRAIGPLIGRSAAIGAAGLSGKVTAPTIVSGAVRAPSIVICVIVLLVCGIFILQTPLQALVTAASTVLCIILALLTRKKTEYYTQTLGRIRGFANFIKTAELGRIKMLVQDNPSYFYDVLPYAWAMGLTKEWSENFDRLGITASPPTWYYSHTPYPMFTYWWMTSSLMQTSRGIETSVVQAYAAKAATERAASGSSGRGFGGGGFGGVSGGGGFSGGGFGGGGGGRW